MRLPGRRTLVCLLLLVRRQVGGLVLGGLRAATATGSCAGGRHSPGLGLGLGSGSRGCALRLLASASRGVATPPQLDAKADSEGEGEGSGLTAPPLLASQLVAVPPVDMQRIVRAGKAASLSLVLMLVLVLQQLPWTTPPSAIAASTSTAASTAASTGTSTTLLLSTVLFPSASASASASASVSSAAPDALSRAWRSLPLPFEYVSQPALKAAPTPSFWDVFGRLGGLETRLQRLEDNMAIGAVLIVAVNFITTFLSGKGMEERMDKQRAEDQIRMDKQRAEDQTRTDSNNRQTLTVAVIAAIISFLMITPVSGFIFSHLPSAGL